MTRTERKIDYQVRLKMFNRKETEEPEIKAEPRVFEHAEVDVNKYLNDFTKLRTSDLRLLRDEVYREIKYCESLLKALAGRKGPAFMTRNTQSRLIILKKYRRAIQEELKSRFQEGIIEIRA